MNKIAKIKIKRELDGGYNLYEINLKKFHDLSIPIDPNKKSPSFYDKDPLEIHHYKDDNNKIWKLEDGAACNIPIMKLNIHCGATHSECRSHITKENLNIPEIVQDSFIPSVLLSITPSNNIGDDTYHHDIGDGDLIITEEMLRKKLDKYSIASSSSIFLINFGLKDLSIICLVKLFIPKTFWRLNPQLFS